MSSFRRQELSPIFVACLLSVGFMGIFTCIALGGVVNYLNQSPVAFASVIVNLVSWLCLVACFFFVPAIDAVEVVSWVALGLGFVGDLLAWCAFSYLMNNSYVGAAMYVVLTVIRESILLPVGCVAAIWLCWYRVVTTEAPELEDAVVLIVKPRFVQDPLSTTLPTSQTATGANFSSA